MKTIKIPRWIPSKKSGMYKLIIQRSGIEETPRAMKVRAQKQECAGVTIPSGFEVMIPGATIQSVVGDSSSVPYVFIEEWKINQILKTIFMEGLRNG